MWAAYRASRWCTVVGSALVRDSGLLDAVEPNAIQHPIEELLDECLLYLLASRYCETDKLTDVAWSLFRDTPQVGRECRRYALLSIII